MKKKLFSLVGRPNVGKSSLFNRLCGKRISITDDEKGTTRDRIYGTVEAFGSSFDLVDTGGIGSSSLFAEKVEEQAIEAIKESDAIIMVIDGIEGVTHKDKEISELLFKYNKPIYLTVNKIDNFNQIDHSNELYSLGTDKVIFVSALHGYQIAELIQLLSEKFPSNQKEEDVSEKNRIKIALIGRPNVGKSTLFNQITGENRSIVSLYAGTTRDSVNIDISIKDIHLSLIDTAGFRRKKSEQGSVEKFAALRTKNAIERADIILLLLDAREGMTSQEKKIARKIEIEGKGCILIFNKWDLVEGYRMEHCLKSFRHESPFLDYCPAIFTSATTGRNIPKIIEKIKEVDFYQTQRVPTPELNQFLQESIAAYPPPTLEGKRLRIYYMVQTGIRPPTFVLFTNCSESKLKTYKRYLIHQLRKRYQFVGNPLLFLFRNKKEETKSTHAREKKIITD